MTEVHVTAFAFPGVGVKLSGAEVPFFFRHRSILVPLLERASSYSKNNLLDSFLGGRLDELSDHELQFFTYAFSVGAAQVFVNSDIIASHMGSYSFGVYGALCASGAVDFDTGLRILDRAYHIMKGALPKQPCSMGVVVGLSSTEVMEILDTGDFPSVYLTNTNSDTCQVVSGILDSLLKFLNQALERDALSADLLRVDIPYHHPEILAGVVPEFRRFLEGLPVTEPRCPIVSSIDQQLLTGRDKLIEFVANNLSSPINWRQVAATFHNLGVTRIVECGPGISLTQNGRFMPFENVKYFNVKNAKRGLRI